MPLGKPGPVTPLFVVPVFFFFFSSIRRLVWVQSPLLIIYGAVLGFSIFYSTFPEVNHFAHDAFACSSFACSSVFAPSLPFPLDVFR